MVHEDLCAASGTTRERMVVARIGAVLLAHLPMHTVGKSANASASPKQTKYRLNSLPIMAMAHIIMLSSACLHRGCIQIT